MQLMSEKINEISAALSKAQRNMKGAIKDSINPHFKNKYADLSSVWDACREALGENDICVVQPMTQIDGKPHLVTLLAHSSGQWMQSFTPLLLLKGTPQEMGSSITYARRYALAAMVGIVQEDDDGTRAEVGFNRVEKPQMRFINDEQLAHIKGWFRSVPAMESYLKERFDIDEIAELPYESYDEVCALLRKSYAKKKAAEKKEEDDENRE